MKQYENEAWLWQQYADEKRSARSIADECGSSHTTIYRHLRLFGIPIRPQRESIARKQPQKQKITMREFLLKLKKIDEAIEELREWQEIIKALKGEESDFYVSPSEAERNRLRDFRKARAEELQKMRKELKQNSDIDSWQHNEHEEWLARLMFEQDERI